LTLAKYDEEELNNRIDDLEEDSKDASAEKHKGGILSNSMKGLEEAVRKLEVDDNLKKFKLAGKVILMDKLGWTGRDYSTKDGLHGKENGIDLQVAGFENMSETQFIQLTRRNKRNTKLGDRFMVVSTDVIEQRLGDFEIDEIRNELKDMFGVTEGAIERAKQEGAVDLAQRIVLARAIERIEAIKEAKNQNRVAIQELEVAKDEEDETQEKKDKLKKAEERAKETKENLASREADFKLSDKLALHAKLMAIREISDAARFSIMDTLKNRLVVDSFKALLIDPTLDLNDEQKKALDDAFHNVLTDKSSDANIVAQLNALDGGKDLASALAMISLEQAEKAWKQVLASKGFRNDLKIASDEIDNAREAISEARQFLKVVRNKMAKKKGGEEAIRQAQAKLDRALERVDKATADKAKAKALENFQVVRQAEMILEQIQQAKLDVKDWVKTAQTRREDVKALKQELDLAYQKLANAEDDGKNRIELEVNVGILQEKVKAKEREGALDYRHARSKVTGDN